MSQIGSLTTFIPDTTILSADINRVFSTIKSAHNDTDTRLTSVESAISTNYIKKDGTVAFSGNINANSNKITNLTSGTSSGDGINKGQLDSSVATLLKYQRNMIDGFIINNNVTDPLFDLDIGTGVAIDITNATLIELSSAITKRADANWVAGTTNGGFIPYDTHLALEASTTYAIVLITNGTLTDVGVIHYSAFSADGNTLLAAGKTAIATATSWTEANIKYRRILSINTDASAQFLQIYQSPFNPEYIEIKSPVLDVTTSTLSTTASLFELPSVPLGIESRVNLTAFVDHASVLQGVYVSSPNTTDLAPSLTVAPLCSVRMLSTTGESSALIEVATNISGQVRARSTGTSTTFKAVVRGYTDKRGAK